MREREKQLWEGDLPELEPRGLLLMTALGGGGLPKIHEEFEEPNLTTT